MKRVRILIADDHALIRRGARAILETQPGWIVCGEASTGQQAVTMAIELKPDVVLMDISLPDINGFEAARQIRASTSTAILFVTMHDSKEFERDAIDSGASGMLSKTDTVRMLVDAVDAVVSRKTFFSPEAQNAETSRGTDRRLTPREREVLRLLAEGCTNKDVAARLGITTKTAETHRARIVSKLHLHSVSALVRYAIRHRIIDG